MHDKISSSVQGKITLYNEDINQLFKKYATKYLITDTDIDIICIPQPLK